MNFYRLASETGFRDLSGARVEGRWNKATDDCLYVVDHPLMCLLESALVQLEPVTRIAPGRGIGVLEVPDGSIRIFTKEELPFGWELVPEFSSRAFGAAQLEAAETLVLGFPARRFEREYHYVINLRHPLAREVKVVDFYYPFPLRGGGD
ncbi:RES family NAD+ phosphorylase [Chitinophaga barathri]|uniref:RES domain-containing protein n=1 Tax=Chitinophaga barathri TaxID=1647451 RepID=A0A3N4MCJ9_9BACT|nr:RES family NAD+ phosphorylase [Chitinophaga barathri]RPD39237.1 RES domain-containing protein [Chitinophaga barathri]